MSERDRLISDFLNDAGWAGATRGVLAADASFRRYDRIGRGDQTAVLMDAPPPREDIRPFARIARHLLDAGYSAPRILAEDEAAGLMLLEDFGDDTYTRLLAQGVDEAALYRLATDFLIDLRRRGGAIVPDWLPPYDEEMLLAEAGLLVDWYVPALSGVALQDEAKADYVSAWRAVLPLALEMPGTLVLRDFHVDNLIRLPGRAGIGACGVLDFQDAVSGPVTYDLVSLLEDARRDIPAALIDEMTERYLDAFPGLDREKFAASMAILGAQRHAKVIGIFTRLCHRDGKPDYLVHIPRVWRLLEKACGHLALAPVRRWLDRNIPADLRRTPEVEPPENA